MRIGKFKLKHYINYIVVALVLAYFGITSATGGHIAGSTLYLLEKLSISMILAVSLSLVVGFLGELSLGHAGFMCVGAYLGGKMATVLEPMLGNGPALLLVTLLVGAAVAAVCGIIIGIPALRLRGDYLAIVTLAFGEIVRSIFLNSSRESFGGTGGLQTPRYPKESLFIFGFILVLITLFVVQNFQARQSGHRSP